MGLFIVIAEHRIESFDIHNSNVVHVKSLSCRFVVDMSGQNVVIDMKIRVYKTACQDLQVE